MRRLAHLVLPVGVAAAVVASRAMHARWRGPVQGWMWYAVLGAMLLAVAVAFGIPEEPDDWQPAIALSIVASLVGTGAVAIVLLLNPDAVPRFVLLLTAVLVVPVYVGSCLLSQATDRRRRRRERVLAVVSADEDAVLSADVELRFPYPEVPFTMAATMGVDDAVSGGLLGEARRVEASLLVLGGAAQLSADVIEQAAVLHSEGVRVRSLVDFYDGWFGKLPLSEVNRMALMTDISSVHGARFASLKRGIDTAAATVGLLVLVGLLPLVLLGNLAANRGPLLFRQRRVGHHGREFVILKLRTMRNADGDDLSSWTSPDDPRITPFGRVLRRTHLDELPQAFNMLRGHLSLVGPRPEQPRYVADLTEKMPMYPVRHVVKPGLTGWAQVKFRYAATEADALEKLQYDLYYIRHQSVTMDMRIVSRTIRRMLFARGR